MSDLMGERAQHSWFDLLWANPIHVHYIGYGRYHHHHRLVVILWSHGFSFGWSIHMYFIHPLILPWSWCIINLNRKIQIILAHCLPETKQKEKCIRYNNVTTNYVFFVYLKCKKKCWKLECCHFYLSTI